MPQSTLVSPYALDEGIRRVSFPLEHVFYVLLVCAGYYGGALIGQSLKFPHSQLSLIWPPTAILLAALLLAPSRRWWVFLFAVAPVHIIVQLKDGVPLPGILVNSLVTSVRRSWRRSASATSLRAVYSSIRLEPYHFCYRRGYLRAFSISSIAAYLYVLSSWGTRILVRMARAGFIQRAVHPDDHSADFDGFRRW